MLKIPLIILTLFISAKRITASSQKTFCFVSCRFKAPLPSSPVCCDRLNAWRLSAKSHPREVVNIVGSRVWCHTFTEVKFERKLAVSHTYWWAFSFGTNTPPGSALHFSRLAKVQHVYMRHITLYKQRESRKSIISPPMNCSIPLPNVDCSKRSFADS